MKIIRKSYIPNINNKENIAPKMAAIVSTMIILVLLVMLLFSNLNNIETIVKIPYIEKLSAEKSNEYSEVSNRLEKLKSEEAELTAKVATIGENDKLYDSIKNLNGVRIEFSQTLKSSLDTKGILRENGDYIFVNEHGNFSQLNSYVFESGDSSILSKSASESVKLLANSLESIMKDTKISKFIKYVAIESHLDTNDVSEASKLLAGQRAQNYLNELLNSNSVLKEKYSNKFIASNCYNNNEILNRKKDIESYSRIDISLYIDEAAVEEGVSKFVK